MLASWIIYKKENTSQLTWAYLKKKMLVYQLKNQSMLSHCIKSTNEKNHMLTLIDADIALEKI